MPCGKRPVVKMWEKPRKIKTVKASKYEQNEASVKIYWKQVIKTLEASYKDDKFWESNCEKVRALVGPKIFHRIAKIFNLPAEEKEYEPPSRSVSRESTQQFYATPSERAARVSKVTALISNVDFHEEMYEDVEEEQEEKELDESTYSSNVKKSTISKSSMAQSKSALFKLSSVQTEIKTLHRVSMKSSIYSKMSQMGMSSDEATPSSDDDLKVHISGEHKKKKRHKGGKKIPKNPHYEMLYCNKSETDMIKWNSKYKQKGFEVSASDEFSKRAEILTKKIAKEFYDWWVGLGIVEFKSEIKRPEDIEDLFQVWFDEHASRELVVDCRILPCILPSIANYLAIKRASCPNVLKRQIAYDILAETSPAHVTAFNTCLPQRMKHIPPKNNTKETWGPVKVPEDLRSMGCVWDDIQHLTSTKAFRDWLKLRPYVPMPPCFKALDAPGEKKQPFVVPSDFVMRAKSLSSTQDLALPVSEFSLELKEFLSKLLA